MVTKVEGIYKNGIIKPVEKVSIDNNTRVEIVILEDNKNKSSLLSLAGIWKNDDNTYNTFRDVYKERRKLSLRRFA